MTRLYRLTRVHVCDCGFLYETPTLSNSIRIRVTVTFAEEMAAKLQMRMTPAPPTAEAAAGAGARNAESAKKKGGEDKTSVDTKSTVLLSYRDEPIEFIFVYFWSAEFDWETMLVLREGDTLGHVKECISNHIDLRTSGIKMNPAGDDDNKTMKQLGIRHHDRVRVHLNIVPGGWTLKRSPFAWAKVRT